MCSLDSKLPFYCVLCHAMLHIQHSKIASYNFIPNLSWSTSPHVSYYYLLTRYSTVNAEEFYPSVSHYTSTMSSSLIVKTVFSFLSQGNKLTITLTQSESHTHTHNYTFTFTLIHTHTHTHSHTHT